MLAQDLSVQYAAQAGIYKDYLSWVVVRLAPLSGTGIIWTITKWSACSVRACERKA